jgi:hypothetical protein
MFEDKALRFMPVGDDTAPPTGDEPPTGGGTSADPPPPTAEANTTNSIAGLTARIRELEAQLSGSQESEQLSLRDHLVELSLFKAGAVDIETATLLLERVLKDSTEELTPAILEGFVRALRVDKPFLFAQEPSPAGAVLASVGFDDDPLHNAAQLAVNQGDRSSLLRYLRLRRGSRG